MYHVNKIDIATELESIPKDPSYVHGSLYAKFCGKDNARKLHSLTKDVSEKLGYVFDHETATWSLPPQ